MSAPRFPMAIYWVLFALIVLIAAAPMLITIFAAAIASANGCTINEGYLVPCIIDGVDRGRDLQAAGVAFWLVLLTWPVALLLFVIWLVVLLTHRARFKRRVALA